MKEIGDALLVARLSPNDKEMIWQISGHDRPKGQLGSQIIRHDDKVLNSFQFMLRKAKRTVMG